MHLLNTTSIIRFVLAPNASPPAESTYDIVVTKPDKSVSYTDSASLSTYIAPTSTVQGHAHFSQLLDQVGMWRFKLNSGTSGSSQVIGEVKIYCIALQSIPIPDSQINRKLVIEAGDLVAPPAALAAPANLTVTANLDSGLTIDWDAVASAESYTIYWRDMSNWTVINTIIVTGAITYAHTGLTIGGIYAYAVSTTAWEVEGEQSAEVSETVIAIATPIGMEDGTFPNGSMSASTSHAAYPASAGRLNGTSPLAWAPSDLTPVFGDEWHKVDLGSIKEISRIDIQGRSGANYRISKFTIEYNDDDGAIWTEYNSGEEIFEVNGSGFNLIATVNLTPFNARYVRLVVRGYVTGAYGRFEWWAKTI